MQQIYHLNSKNKIPLYILLYILRAQFYLQMDELDFIYKYLLSSFWKDLSGFCLSFDHLRSNKLNWSVCFLSEQQVSFSKGILMGYLKAGPQLCEGSTFAICLDLLQRGAKKNEVFGRRYLLAWHLHSQQRKVLFHNMDSLYDSAPEN